MLRWSINLFRIRGIQLSLHASFLLLITYYGVKGYREAGAKGLAWELALLIAFVTCIVLHELGHSFTAKHFGVNVRRILLMPIGGMAEFDAIPREPRKELLITVAGPAVNFAIATLLYLGLTAYGVPLDTAEFPANASEFLWTIAVVNLVLGLFNLIPVFPMDGGRILRALLAWRLSYVRATFWAATVGKVLAVAGILAAIALGVWSDLPAFTAWLYVALFVFIFTVGELEYRAVQIRETQDRRLAEWAARLAAARDLPLSSTEANFPDEPPLLGRN